MDSVDSVLCSCDSSCLELCFVAFSHLDSFYWQTLQYQALNDPATQLITCIAMDQASDTHLRLPRVCC
jgi:hypothetical protein